MVEVAIKEGYPAFHVRNALNLQEEENAQTLFTPSEIIIEIHNPKWSTICYSIWSVLVLCSGTSLHTHSLYVGFLVCQII